jgi:hypothetical protein
VLSNDVAKERRFHLSFQAYLDAIETKTGHTPRQLLALASERGLGPNTKAGPIIEWLKEDYGLGRGHAMAMVHVITKGDRISSKHVGTTGTHADASDRLWLDVKATMPEDWYVGNRTQTAEKNSGEFADMTPGRECGETQ